MMEVLVALEKELSMKSIPRMNHTHYKQILAITEGPVLREEVSMSRNVFQPLGERQGQLARRIFLAEQNICNRITRRVTQVP